VRRNAFGHPTIGTRDDLPSGGTRVYGVCAPLSEKFTFNNHDVGTGTL
jgi:hypothetical protein